MPPAPAVAAPLALHRETVRPDWIDYNGHMNVAYYGLIFDHASDAFFEFAGIGETHRRRDNGSAFIAEAHITYDAELSAGADVRCDTVLLDFDDKRIHLFHRMIDTQGEVVAAATELMALHVDLATRRVAPMPAAARDRLAEIRAAHAALARPEQAGRVIGIRRKAPG